MMTRVVASLAIAVLTAALPVGERTPAREKEPVGVRGKNDDVRTAQKLTGAKAAVTGTLSSPAPALTPVAPNAGDDGSIRTARDLGSGHTVEGLIGDARGDLDFYRVDAKAGDTVIVRVTALSATLDPEVLLYDAQGHVVAGSDDRINDENPLIVERIDRTGAYYAMVSGSGNVPADPFRPGPGNRAASTGPYTIALSSTPADVDVYGIHAREGDILSAALTGDGGDQVSLLDGGGAILQQSSGNGGSLYPSKSPLARGRITADAVAPATGWYYVAVTGRPGPYRLDVRGDEPALAGTGRTQSFFLDFDGARLDPALFASSIPVTGKPGPRSFAPLASFLPKWGLTGMSELPLERAIAARVRADLRAAAPDAAVTVVTTDVFGQPDVSRVVIGGTSVASGLPTIGVAQSVDPGNFDTDETAVVMLDFLSAPKSSPSSANAYLGARGDRVRYLGDVLGDYVTHEIGHLLGNWHTEPTNGVQGLMDSTNIARIVAGPDGVGGTPDDAAVPFVSTNEYRAVEGLTGIEDTKALVRAGLDH